MNSKLATALLLSLASLTACSKKNEGSSAPAVTFDADGVNALVPADLKDKLVFEKRDIPEERGKRTTTYTIVAPKGWQPRMKGFASVEPPKDGPDLGFMTSFSVGGNCDGMCQPKNWAETADKVNFSQFKGDKIVDDKTTKTSRLLIAEKGDNTYVVYAWWSDGAPRYHTCQATLEAPVKGAAQAFAKACQAVAISGDE
ncbi:MAG: hypothetical protein HOV81_01845 [Kofleriaceae bacterium]|nr:hypothetical protein [Kofleriaceae bacterium]